MNTEYGLIVSSELLKEKSSDGSYVFTGLTRKNFDEIKSKSGAEAALAELSNKINHNLSLTENIIEFLPKLNISHYRVNNSIFSLLCDFNSSSPILLQDLPDALKIETRVRALGFLARQHGISLSVYPESKVSLISEEDKLDNLIKELDFHSWFFETAGFPANFSNPIVIEPNEDPKSKNHEGAIDFIKKFYSNFQKLKEETRSRVVIKNTESGFWNAVNLFKYFHVYLQEKFNNGLALSFDNYADSVNSGSFDASGKEIVENYIHIGAFHETWKGAVPIFLWSERDKSNSKITAEYLSDAIPDFNYNIKWECDVRKRDKAIIKYTMPEEEDKVTEEVIMTITKNKYKKSQDFSRAFNALYDGN